MWRARPGTTQPFSNLLEKGWTKKHLLEKGVAKIQCEFQYIRMCFGSDLRMCFTYVL